MITAVQEVVVRSALACSTLMFLTACATQLISYAPTENQTVVYDRGVGAVTWETNEAVLTMYPTFRYQSPADFPTFTLMVHNKTVHNIDFVPERIHAYLDDRDCHVYTLEERVGDIRSAAKRKQIALAVLGMAAAGAAAYGASHQTTTYTSYGVVGNHPFWTSGTIQTYDPAAGILAGAAVGGATGVGIDQIARAAGYEEQAAQAIFQHSTIRPRTTIVGQVILKPASSEYGMLRLDIPVETARATFTFTNGTTHAHRPLDKALHQNRQEMLDSPSRESPANPAVTEAGPATIRSHSAFGLEMTPLSGMSFGTDGFTGVMVKTVLPQSVAAEAGIKAGDIVLKVGEQGINEPNDVQTSLAAIDPGEVIPIQLMRKARFIWVDAQF